MSRIQKMIFEAVEAAEAGLKHSNVEEIQYRRKESPIPHQKWKNPLDFCSISDRSVPLGVALLPWVFITALASSGVKPTLGSKAPPSGTLLPEMEKNLQDFSLPMKERDIPALLLFCTSKSAGKFKVPEICSEYTFFVL